MIYENIPTITKDKFIREYSSVTDEQLCLLLLGLDDSEDFEWLLNTYIHYLKHKNFWVASAAISGIGDLARKTKALDKNIIVKLLNDIAESRHELKSKVNDAIDDLNHFC